MSRRKKGDTSGSDLHSEMDLSGGASKEPANTSDTRHTPDIMDLFKLFQESDEKRRREEATREEQRRQEEWEREEQRRRDETAREEKFQNLLTMMQTQLESHQKEKKELEDARSQELARGRKLEEHRLAELEKQRQLEEKRHLEFIALEKEKLQAESRRQAERDTARRQEEARRLKERELDRKLREAPSFPRMTETVDMELYISDFEHHMKDLEIPGDRWLTSLRPLLSNWARTTLDLLGEEKRGDYKEVKTALLEAYCNEKGSLGHRLVVTKRQKGQNSAQYLTHRQRMWRHWTDAWDKEEAGARLNMEFYYAELPYACRNYCRERNPKTLMEMAAIVDKFFSDRDSHLDDPRWACHDINGPTNILS